MIITVKNYDSYSVHGFILNIEGELKNKPYFTGRVFGTLGEAEIAKGLLLLRPDINFDEYELLLKSILRLAYSTKTWSTDQL